MEKRKAKRIYVKQSPVSKRQLDKWRAQIAEEHEPGSLAEPVVE